ncbi:muskelin [Schizosaccharomyces octosporus yFS286]|uniref:Muskelin n=1 Tax=Schizosaccharomyces octosporus (strain yFS286) TaxID=483514 RepID=S9Q2K6_SCHOY|nr:muskelin [Schizosaccharomyces octosporus yFS286]EPX73938.1 muskelin [Schizosaccharomyces octosporus yFS286]
MEQRILPYTIHDWSSYSGKYHPYNIAKHEPRKVDSRWSCANSKFFSKLDMQYVLLKLKEPCVVTDISFGKYCAPHLCNLKEFAVYGGRDQWHLRLLLKAGLTNDSNTESFVLQSQKESPNIYPFVCKYIKIVPLQAHAPEFNLSIWYVELHGYNAPHCLSTVEKQRVKELEKKAIKYLLSYFLYKGNSQVYSAIAHHYQIPYMLSPLNLLYNAICESGDLYEAINLFQNKVWKEISQKWRKEAQPKLLAEEISKFGRGIGSRSGHQMVYNSRDKCIYHYGGWDGIETFSDFWKFSVETQTWSLLGSNQPPGKRVCHRMILDSSRQCIYLLGNYFGTAGGNLISPDVKPDFWKYSIEERLWTCLSKDTSLELGPMAIFDQAMALNEKENVIYICGGCKWDPGDLVFETFYLYHVDYGIWEKKVIAFKSSNANMKLLTERMGHCMEYASEEGLLYIFGGQTHDQQFLADMHVISTSSWEAQSYDWSQRGKDCPYPAFCQRSSLDEENQRIFAFYGYEQREYHKILQPSIWAYYIKQKQWKKVIDINEKIGDPHPCARFGHALAVNWETETFYISGGNASSHPLKPMKLKDFWKLQINEEWGQDTIYEQILLELHIQRFHELKYKDPVEAVYYLQTELQPRFKQSQTFWIRMITGIFKEKLGFEDLKRFRMETFEKIRDLLPHCEDEIVPSDTLLNMVELF